MQGLNWNAEIWECWNGNYTVIFIEDIIIAVTGFVISTTASSSSSCFPVYYYFLQIYLWLFCYSARYVTRKFKYKLLLCAQLLIFYVIRTLFEPLLSSIVQNVVFLLTKGWDFEIIPISSKSLYPFLDEVKE